MQFCSQMSHPCLLICHGYCLHVGEMLFAAPIVSWSMEKKWMLAQGLACTSPSPRPLCLCCQHRSLSLYFCHTVCRDCSARFGCLLDTSRCPHSPLLLVATRTWRADSVSTTDLIEKKKKQQQHTHSHIEFWFCAAEVRQSSSTRYVARSFQGVPLVLLSDVLTCMAKSVMLTTVVSVWLKKTFLNAYPVSKAHLLLPTFHSPTTGTTSFRCVCQWLDPSVAPNLAHLTHFGQVVSASCRRSDQGPAFSATPHVCRNGCRHTGVHVRNAVWHQVTEATMFWWHHI